MKFTILVDNRTEYPDCCAEWGLSIFIESKGRNYLFDTGSSPMFAENARNLGIEIKDAEHLIISHGHYDHTGGMEKFIELNEKAPVYIHEEAAYKMYGETDGVMDDYNCGILWNDELWSKVDKRKVKTKGICKINESAYIVGNIPSMPEYPPAEHFYRIPAGANQESGNSNVEEDPMNHEQFLAIEEDEKIYIFSGCSHKGVIPIISYASEIFSGKKIAGFIGGMHLYSAGPQMRNSIIEKLADSNLDFVVPMHCTGIEATFELKKLMGDRCRLISTGESLVV